MNDKSEKVLKNRDRFINLGLVIALIRKRKGFYQEQLAEKSTLSRSTISKIEAANLARPITLDSLYKIADALDMKAGDLLNFELLSRADLNCRFMAG
ncbi:helix-turn-helix domain-containing protein [Ligilactobacillus ruminis]|uniref:helix-turn-helix domain-containing protein n=1 Tax=Ligilactobacillus ruminis TaxID=1623 RepID=UPI0022E1C661|nr:helix-turn-helix transcriptional regulator [Ligilactobacillus ruminis]